MIAINAKKKSEPPSMMVQGIEGIDSEEEMSAIPPEATKVTKLPRPSFRQFPKIYIYISIFAILIVLLLGVIAFANNMKNNRPMIPTPTPAPLSPTPVASNSANINERVTKFKQDLGNLDFYDNRLDPPQVDLNIKL